jgi:hypothetical protein
MRNEDLQLFIYAESGNKGDDSKAWSISSPYNGDRNKLQDMQTVTHSMHQGHDHGLVEIYLCHFG